MRSLFLLDPDLVFLNHGSFGACPREVLEAQQDWQRQMERNPVSFLARQSAELLAKARESLGLVIGARGTDLVFIPNSTTGVNIVARSLPLAAGDEILTTDLEYGACDATWRRVCAATGALYRRVEIPLPLKPDEAVARLLAGVTPRTKLIYASHLTSATAVILPVEAICAAARELGIPTLIDGAHAPGQIELSLDTLGADFYVGNCHKWMCAPKGSAFLHARPERQPWLHAPVTSWGYESHPGGPSAHDAYLGLTEFERRLQWQGTRDLSPWLAVPTAIEFQARHDWLAIRERCHEWAREALEALTQRHGLTPIADDRHWAQMVAIPVPSQDAEALRHRLYKESSIEVAVTTHAGRTFVRLSVQVYNTPDDLQRLLDAPALR